jgi:hypothetical protein
LNFLHEWCGEGEEGNKHCPNCPYVYFLIFC